MAPTSVSSSSSNHLPEVTGRIPTSSTDLRSTPPASTITRNGSKQGSDPLKDQDETGLVQSLKPPPIQSDSPLESLDTLSKALPASTAKNGAISSLDSPQVVESVHSVGVDPPLLLPLQNSALGLVDYDDAPLYRREGEEMNGYENGENDFDEFELKRRLGVTKFFNVSKGESR